MTRLRAAFVLGILGVLPACGDERPSSARAKPSLFPAPQPTALECRFEPLSRPGERAESGFEMCFSPAQPEPWWTEPTSSDAGMTASPDAAAKPETTATCPEGMLLVDGMYCPRARHKCLRFAEEPGAKFLKKQRCAEYDRNPTCLGKREHRRFCIDRYEHAAEPGGLPLAEQSWTGAKEICQSLGKRLCFDSEWEFACEGEQMLPYPYGFVRDATRCNHDRSDLIVRGKMQDLRERGDARPNCKSPFGAVNMVGNVDEWTHRDGFIRPWRASLRGGWWLAGRNNCRAATGGHDEYYFGGQTGVRCCKSAR